MQDQVNHQSFVAGTLADLADKLNSQTDDVQQAITNATGITDPALIDQHRQSLQTAFSGFAAAANAEVSESYPLYVSRIDAIGVYQSVLAKLFQDFPDLQGYGDKNISWVLTPVEEIFHFIKGFFSAVHKDIHGNHKSILQAVIEAWKEVSLDRAPYPPGVPQPITFGDDAKVALLADWGGDNLAAKHIADVAKRANSDITIHLGDIYYGGTKEECEAFLRNWPVQGDEKNPGSSFPPGSSYALNGNHEMYTGGESFFKVVLPAFQQPQPFFCLQNTYWRLIGLDTAYIKGDGSLRMSGDQSEGITRQWKWLVDLLKLDDGRKNILLTHHQPVSAHAAEYGASQKLRDDIAALIQNEGVAKDAIFGWFFGHEHRAAVYDDTKTDYNARLIGSGCIPHLRQTETACDPGCTPFVGVNGRGEWGTQSAISMYVQMDFIGPAIEIMYVCEDNNEWGQEQWNAEKGRLGGVQFAVIGTTYTS